ncbi:MAG: synthase [Thermaerobacter sp.]|nr:synthase [Thermaerobacter sp.]
MKTCVLGSFPKIPAGSGASVRSAVQRFERGAIGPRELSTTFRDVTARVVNLADAAHLDVTTDGQIRWYDLFDPLARDIDNFRPSGLLRLFDNNFYYRHPVITGRLQFQGGTLAAWTREAAALSRIPLKVALPGPFTVLALSEDQSYRDRARWLADVVDVLRLEADSLTGTGAVEVQWDEPALAALPGAERGEVRDVYAALTGGAQLVQSIALYWGLSARWLGGLEGLPVARVYVDAVSDPAVLAALAETVWPFEVGAGLLDARSVRAENPDEVLSRLEPVLRRQGADRVWLHPSSGLELLPPDRAEQKVLALGAIKNLINGQKGR